jgi:hypothetical protein
MDPDDFCILLIGVGLLVDAVAIFFGYRAGRRIHAANEGRGFFEDDALTANDEARADALITKAAARAGDWRIVGWCGLGTAVLGVTIGVAMRL